MSEQAIFASDLHGNRYAYERLFGLAEERKIRTVILGGDLTPKWPILSFGGGALVPLEPGKVRQDPNKHTYVDFLRRVKELVGRNRLAAERHFTALGGFVVYVQPSMFWETLIAEQEILRKVIDSVRPGETPADRVVMSVAEWQVVERLLRELPNPPANLEVVLSGMRYHTLSHEDVRRALQTKELVRREFDALAKDVSPEVRHYLAAKIAAFVALAENCDLETLLPYCQAAANAHTLAQAIQSSGDLSKAIEPQKRFLTQYFKRRIETFRRKVPGARVYLIPGNDDMEECVPVIQQLHDRGLVIRIDQGAVELAASFKIVGYPYVRASGGMFYDAWEKPEQEIEEDLRGLEADAGDPERTIFVVHSPPHNTGLDLGFADSSGKVTTSLGSQGVRQWLGQSRKHLVLSGHIHEAPFVNGGNWRRDIDGTLCIQPGGWHGEGLCAAVFDLEDPRQSVWIHDATKIQSS